MLEVPETDELRSACVKHAVTREGGVHTVPALDLANRLWGSVATYRAPLTTFEARVFTPILMEAESI
jgi:hypothetical protein